ncbi:MAG: AgmX/PglI C-terminal domain-containing protein [Myxococcales bacterium]|nr:AgmX/PglI C-terminal domain-containing protein [Myxococcales bacterium]
MRLVALIPVVILALVTSSCRRTTKKGDGTPGPDVAARVNDAAGPVSAPTEMPAGDASTTETPACDVSTTEKAIDAFVRITGNEEERAHRCAMPVPEIGAAIVGKVATEVGCLRTHVIHRCRVYGVEEAASRVLTSMGWTTAPPPERERLAMLWVRKVVFADMEIAGGEILETAMPVFERAGRTFTPPRAQAQPDGGVLVDMWVLFEGGMGPASVGHSQFVFAPDATMESKSVDEFYLYEYMLSEPARPRLGRVRSYSGGQPAGGSGKMDGWTFRRVLAEKSEALDACYQEKLRSAPTLAGELTFIVAISARGTVTVEVERNDPGLDAAGVTACIQAVLSSMSFTSNPPQGGDFRVRLPLSLVAP